MIEPLRCPVCRAEYLSGTQCRRCRADLSLLAALEGQRDRLLAAASASLAAGQLEEAVGHAREAAALRSGADSAQVEALAQLLQRDFEQAWRCYRQTV